MSGQVVSAWPAVLFAAFFALAPIFAAPLASAVQDPSLKWSTIQTDHFRVTYHSGLEALAERVANAGEEARRRLVLFLGYEPKGKVEVLVIDRFDDPNAIAMVVPQNMIVVYATSPPDLSTLADYDDWMLALMIHEYAHILHLDNWGGIVTLLNHIFGKQYIPNAVQPLWILEGYTIYAESTRTGGGRLNSSTWEMYLRMAALEDKLLPIDEVSSGTIEWPHGTAFYLYGSFFLQWVAERYGEDFMWKYAHDYGNDLLPFGINRDIQKITGKTWVELYSQWRQEVKEKYTKQETLLRKEGLREGMRITFDGETDRSPRFSPDGKKIAFFADTGNERSSIYLLDSTEPRNALAKYLKEGKKNDKHHKGKWKPRKLLEVTGQVSLAWMPDSWGLIYSRSESWKNWYQFHDLYYVDISTPEEPERLTFGKRSRQPDISPDGTMIAYTINRAGSSFLVVGQDPLRPDEAMVIDELPLTGQAYSPRFSPDGKKVAYATWLPGGRREIRIVDIETKKVRIVAAGRTTSSSPVWDPKGRFLYFCSDMTGISNIYAYKLDDGSLWQVSNVIGGTFMPDVSPDGAEIVYIGYTSKGYDLYLLPVLPHEWTMVSGARGSGVGSKAAPKEGDTGMGSSGKGETEKDTRPEADLSWTTLEKNLKPKRYNPLRTLYPKAWTFRIEPDGFGESITAWTVSSDIAGQHLIGASIHVGLTGKRRIGYSFNYSFLKLPVDLSLSHSRYVTPQGGLRIDDQWKLWPEIGYRTALSLSYPFQRNDFSQSVFLGYRLTYMMPAEKIEPPVDPNAALPLLPDTGFLSGFELGWRFTNIKGSTFGISAEQGGAVWVNVGFDLPQLGSDYTAVTISYAAAGFVRVPGLKHHVIAARFGGGYGSSNFGRRGLFVVGGFPEQDILRDMINMRGMWSVALRGYPPAVAFGEQFYLFNLEYRIPLLDIFRGFWTLPWQLGRLYMSIFTDTGGAWWAGKFDWKGVKTGLGAELFVSMTFGYYLSYTFRIGYAYGFMEGGGHDYYLVLSTPF